MPLSLESPEFSILAHANGLPDDKRAAQLLKYCAKTDEEKSAFAAVLGPLLIGLGESADPPLALLNFSNLCDRIAEKSAFFIRLLENPPALSRLARLFGWSQALSDAVIRQSENLELVFAGAAPISRPTLRKLAANCADLDALRRFRKAQFLRIGLLDLESDSWRDAADFSLVVRQISDLAQVVLERVLALISPEKPDGFCVILMGKGGARELNYSSDVDLIFLAEERADAAQIGEKLLRVLGEITASGFLWRADMRLRPDGRNGALVTPLSYALSYYESYAGAWEWQALIKARAVAGDARLGRRFRKFTRGITWARRADDSHLREVFEMKKRSEKTADGQNARNLKSGPGGIRDAEWCVQQLQMMLGPSRPRARAGATLRALEVLDELDALSPDETRQLRESYLWLRVAEHRLQLWNEQAVRELPEKTAEKAALARRLGCNWRGEAAARFLDEEKTRHSAEVRALTQRLFWAFSGETGENWLERFPPAVFAQNAPKSATETRLERLAGGTQTRPLPAPLSRQIRAVLPDAFSGFERAIEGEQALVAFENLAEASGNRLSLFRALASAPTLSRAIWTVLGGSQFLAQTLVKFPQLLDLAANRALLSRARSREEARFACRDYCYPFRDQNAALRRWRARELLRIGLRDLVMDVSPLEITAEISYLANACLEWALECVQNSLPVGSNRVPLGVLAMGKCGGFEMHYASDCDVVFVSESDASGAGKIAEEFIRFCGGRTAEGPLFEVDARLRPYGQSGPLVTTLGALRDYFERSELGFATWERQALTKARIAAGDTGLGARAMALVFDAAFPATWNAGWSDELRHIKARVENERGAKSKGDFDAKLGAGALSDIEWCAQWLAMKWGAKFSQLQTPNTLRQLRGAHDAQLISEAEFAALEAAFLWLHRAQLRRQIARENAGGAVKNDSPELLVWARALFPELEKSAARARFEEEWKTHTSRAREIFERVRGEL